jgi:hypothetical protein
MQVRSGQVRSGQVRSGQKYLCWRSSRVADAGVWPREGHERIRH